MAELVGTETIGSLPQALEVLSAFGSDAGRSQVEQATATVLTDVIALRLEVASRQERSDETVAARAYASGSDPSTDTFTGLAWWEYAGGAVREVRERLLREVQRGAQPDQRHPQLVPGDVGHQRAGPR